MGNFIKCWYITSLRNVNALLSWKWVVFLDYVQGMSLWPGQSLYIKEMLLKFQNGCWETYNQLQVATFQASILVHTVKVMIKGSNSFCALDLFIAYWKFMDLLRSVSLHLWWGQPFCLGWWQLAAEMLRSSLHCQTSLSVNPQQ